MNEKKIPLVNDIPKHKKKSSAKGQPRSKHKHCYDTVLLKVYYNFPDVRTGKPRITYTESPTKVCTICGRVDYIDRDPSFYKKTEVQDLPFRIMSTELSDKALQLPKWCLENFRDKFAVKGELHK